MSQPGDNGDFTNTVSRNDVSLFNIRGSNNCVVKDDNIAEKGINSDRIPGKVNSDAQPVKSESHSKRTGALLYLADNLIGGLLVGPLTVFCWRGMWNLVTAYVFPNDKDLSGYTCAAIGNVGLLIVAFIQTFLKSHLRVDNKLHWWLGYHVFTCVCFVLNVCHWHGMWFLLDYFLGLGFQSAWISFAIGQGFMLLFRCTKTAQAPPMIIAVDTDPDFFTYTTRFHTKAKVSENHILDVSFTVIIIHQLVVFYWRGVWNAMEAHLYPTNLVSSALAGLVIAGVLIVVVIVAQPGFNSLYRRVHSPVLKWVLEVVIFFMAHIINVAVWRGIWILCDAYILPDRPDISCTITLLVGWFALTVMGCGHSLTVRGCEIDGDATDENGCMCANKYIRFFVDEKKGAAVGLQELQDVPL